MDRIHELPYPGVFLFFWCLAMMRSHTMYWMGRGVTAGTARSRWAAVLDTPVYVRARAWSARWGVLAVPLSFLTVGLQSAIQLSAGVTRMPLHRYALATAVGALAWAGVYTTIGMAVLAAWYTSPAGRVVAVTAVGTLAVVIVARYRRARQGTAPAVPTANSAAQEWHDQPPTAPA